MTSFADDFCFCHGVQQTSTMIMALDLQGHAASCLQRHAAAARALAVSKSPDWVRIRHNALEVVLAHKQSLVLHTFHVRLLFALLSVGPAGFSCANAGSHALCGHYRWRLCG